MSACGLLNDAVTEALPRLHPMVNSLLMEMAHGDLEIANLVYEPVGLKAAWNLEQRGLMGGVIRPAVSYRNHQLERAQHFLNEARLSALALAVYFAGRLVCTPAVDDGAPKLLVLDDALIGLDHSNWLPVLDLLANHFSSWQVVLLTHDRGWFDMARGWLDRKAWQCVEIFEGDSCALAPMPIVRATANYPAKQYLVHAKQMLANHYVEASANYARQAFEAALRGGCQHNNIRVAFRQNTKDVKAEDLLKAVQEWAKEPDTRRRRFEPPLVRLRLLRDVVLNPYSHPLAPNIPTAEVRDAIAEVEKLIAAFAGDKASSKLQDVDA